MAQGATFFGPVFWDQADRAPEGGLYPPQGAIEMHTDGGGAGRLDAGDLEAQYGDDYCSMGMTILYSMYL